MLARGAERDVQDVDGITPLMNAVVCGDVTIIASLLHAGADVNLQNKYGETALHWAAAERNRTAIEVLLSFGADRHVVAHDGRTARDAASWIAGPAETHGRRFSRTGRAASVDDAIVRLLESDRSSA